MQYFYFVIFRPFTRRLQMVENRMNTELNGNDRLMLNYNRQAQISNKTAPQTLTTASGSPNDMNTLMTGIIQSPTHSLQNQAGKWQTE